MKKWGFSVPPSPSFSFAPELLTRARCVCRRDRWGAARWGRALARSLARQTRPSLGLRFDFRRSLVAPRATARLALAFPSQAAVTLRKKS